MRSAGAPNTFSLTCSALYVSEALHLPLHAQVKAIEGLYVSAYAVGFLHVPKPMFVFAFEGALLAFIVNGDRFVLLALLPRRKPRTDGSVQPPYHSLFKELNLTTGGYYPSRVPKADGMDFCVLWQWHRCHT